MLAIRSCGIMKNLLCPKNTLKGNSSRTINLFLIFSLISLICVIVLAALSEGGALNSILYGYDYYMDFFNSICDASTRGVYSERGVIYPPLSNLIFFTLSKMVPSKYAMLEFEGGQRLQMHESGLCQILFVIFVSTMVFGLGILFYDTLQRSKSKIAAFATSLFLVISFPMIYCIQRGNIILLSLLLSVFFVFYRNSENKVIRELSYIALALAAGIKIFPALFGLLLINDKKYKEAGRLVIYGVLAFFVPFAFYGGIDGFLCFINNIFAFSGDKTTYYSISGTSISNVLSWIALGFGMDLSLTIKIAKLIVYAGCIFVFVFAKEDWKKLTAIFLIIANVDSLARFYILIFLLIPFVSYILKHSSGKMNTVFGILFGVLIITIPCFWYFKMGAITDILHDGYGINADVVKLLGKPNVLISPFIIVLFELLLTIDTAVCLKRRTKAAKTTE